MSKQIVKKTVAGALIVTTIATSTVEVKACDAAAVMETTKQVSIMAGPLAPVVLVGGAAVAAGTGIVIGIKNKSKETDNYIYQSLGHLPDHWKPNSVVEKINPNGRIVQRRFYDYKGKPKYDVDLTNHGTPEYHPFGHGGAHIHHYRGGRRLRGQELTDGEYQRFVQDFDSKAADKMRVEYKPDNK